MELSELRSEVFQPGDDGYQALAGGWNSSVTHHPELVVTARDAADVQAAVRLAQTRGWSVGVRATGHGADVPADGAVLISTRELSDVQIDPERRIATVGAGATSDALVSAAARHGLALRNGSSGQVGAVGYLVGGGLPVLGRAFGYGVDGVLAFDLVTADGELKHVTADRHPDLFWAVRGGKDNFGVVVRMDVELVAVDRFYGGGLYYDGDQAEQVLGGYLNWVADLPRQVSPSLSLMRFPPAPVIPEPMRGRFLVHLRIAHLGDVDEGIELTQPLRDLGPVIDDLAERPYPETGEIYHDPHGPVRATVRSTLLRPVPATDADALAQALAEAAGPGVAAPFGGVELRALGGALADSPSRPSCLGHRDAGFHVFLASATPPDKTGAVQTFQQSVLAAVGPWDTGAAIPGFLTPHDVTPELVGRAYDPADYQRLSRIKAEHDPGNLFRAGHNIPPARKTEA
jgi:FAD/FMN-containing dehydrogenase